MYNLILSFNMFYFDMLKEYFFTVLFGNRDEFLVLSSYIFDKLKKESSN